MTDEEVKEVYARAEMEYEMLKDKVHDQYDEIQELKSKITKAIEYIKENKVDLSWFMTTDKNLKIEGISNVVSTFRLLEILGDKENE